MEDAAVDAALKSAPTADLVAARDALGTFTASEDAMLVDWVNRHMADVKPTAAFGSATTTPTPPLPYQVGSCVCVCVCVRVRMCVLCTSRARR